MESSHLVPQLTLSTSLYELLSYDLVLYQTVPYLTPSSLLALGATSRSFNHLIHETPGVWRHLDLTNVKSAKFELAAIDHGGEVWRNVQMDENVTEDEFEDLPFLLTILTHMQSFYGGPLQSIFNKLQKQRLLQNVQTLILDGLSVTSDLVCDIILLSSFNVRVLSIREVQNLNENKLRQALSYAVRPTRAEGSPKLQALYIFGPRDPDPSTFRKKSKVDYSRVFTVPTGSIMHSQGAQIGAEWNEKSSDWLSHDIQTQDKWYQKAGKIFTSGVNRPPSTEWELIMRECEGIISFDAVLCRSPRHSDIVPERNGKPSLPWYTREPAYIRPRAATRVLEGCHGCGSAPEGFSVFGKSPHSQLPLLAPLPLHASTQRACKAPFQGTSKQYLFARCVACMRNRCCESCQKWWCEDCYEIPEIVPTIKSFLESPVEIINGRKRASENKIKPGVLRSCFECGMNCASCIKQTQLTCKICNGGYCTIHNEGSSLTTCDWCATSGRRTRAT